MSKGFKDENKPVNDESESLSSVKSTKTGFAGFVEKISRRANAKSTKAELIARNKKKYERYSIDPEKAELDESTLRNILFVLTKRYVSLIVVGVLVFSIFSLGSLISSSSTASTILTLNYEQSAKGLNPNGSRFNIAEIRSEEVLKQAIEYAGLSGKMKPHDLEKCIIISETKTRKVNDANNKDEFYIATSYDVKIEKPTAIFSISARNLLDFVCKAYKEYFFANYTNNDAIIKGDYTKVDSLEYKEIGSYFKLRQGQLDGYLKIRQNEQKGFIASNGETFTSLRKHISNLAEYQVDNFNSYVWENGVVKDAEQYKATLNFQNVRYGQEYTIDTNEYDIRNLTIDEFRDSMAVSVLIPTTNNYREFYMGRTKTGLDYLATAGNEFLTKAKTVRDLMNQNSDRLSKLGKGTSSSKDKANNMIEICVTEFKRIEELIAQVDSEYTNQKTKNYMAFDDLSTSFISRLNLSTAFAAAFIAVLALFIYYYYEYTSAVKGVSK